MAELHLRLLTESEEDFTHEAYGRFLTKCENIVKDFTNKEPIDFNGNKMMGDLAGAWSEFNDELFQHRIIGHPAKGVFMAIEDTPNEDTITIGEKDDDENDN